MPDGSKLGFERIYPFDAEFDTFADMPDEVQREQALQGARRRQHPGLDRAARGRLRRAVRRHRRPLARQRLRGEEPAPRDEPQGLPGRDRRQRVLDRLDGAALRSDHAEGRLVRLALVHGERARDPRLRRRHELGEGGARERHARARLRGGPQVGPSRELHLRRSACLARRERHRLHRRDDRVLQGELAASRGAHAREVGATAAFLASPLGTGITGTTVYVDKGFSAMGKTV